MFCEKCGKPIPEGLTECPDCNPVAQETEQLVQEEAVTEAPVIETEIFEEPSFEEPVKVKKKRGKAKNYSSPLAPSHPTCLALAPLLASPFQGEVASL